MNFFHEEHVVQFIKENCLRLIWIATLIIAVTTAARQIPADRESRTIFPLLAKPIARWQVLIGKFLGCWLATGFALLVFYVFFALVSASREHSGGGRAGRGAGGRRGRGGGGGGAGAGRGAGGGAPAAGGT